MGQNSEEAAELVATIRGEHVVMKNWFMSASKEAKALRDKYGPYPGLWKEVLNWPGWKEARKAYLGFTQTGGSSSTTNDDSTTTTNDSSNGGSAVPHKRRSRWGVAEDNNDHANNDGPNKRRSRWGRDQPSAPPPPVMSQPLPGLGLPGLGLPGMPANLPPQQQEEMRRHQTRLKDINHRLENLDQEALRVDGLPRGHRDRSPSPPPGTSFLYLVRVSFMYFLSFSHLLFRLFLFKIIVYGPDGKRKNTRAVRWRQSLTTERQDMLEKLMNLNPATKQSGLFKRKRTKKIRIPIEKHPQYNFIGLIIGPRGKTQKELESKTGCKIAIRGRGSVKEGARGRRDGKMMEGDDEPLHVVITGDDQRSVDAATDMIEQMLVVIDDEKNMHKQQQLRELALLNGTLKEDEFCQICAEKGHRSFECPRRFAMNKSSVTIKCAICGDTSHPTRDCTQKPQEATNEKEMDSDYMSFMAELDGKKVEKPPSTPAANPNVCPPVGGGNAAGNTILKPASVVPGGLPPPPAGLLPPSAGGLPPPPPGLPPPPMAGLLSPPGASAPRGGPPGSHYNAPPGQQPPNGNYYGNQQHYGNQQYQQQPQQGGNYYGNQQQQPYGNQYQQQQQQQQQPPPHGQQPPVPQPGTETQAWDYTSYYGSSGKGGDAGGAGGFNWWG
jgi:splicing factor 1